MSATNSLHYELCKLGAKFLMSRKNAEHWHTPNKFAVVELICQGAENPDIWATNGMYTTLVEVKTSRSDFLADKRKYVRSKDAEEKDLQLGNFRYYLCPAGVISVEDLPENWGLLEYDGKKIHKIQAAELAMKVQKLQEEQKYCYTSPRRNAEINAELLELSRKRKAIRKRTYDALDDNEAKRVRILLREKSPELYEEIYKSIPLKKPFVKIK